MLGHVYSRQHLHKNCATLHDPWVLISWRCCAWLYALLCVNHCSLLLASPGASASPVRDPDIQTPGASSPASSGTPYFVGGSSGGTPLTWWRQQMHFQHEVFERQLQQQQEHLQQLAAAVSSSSYEVRPPGPTWAREIGVSSSREQQQAQLAPQPQEHPEASLPWPHRIPTAEESNSDGAGGRHRVSADGAAASPQIGVLEEGPGGSGVDGGSGAGGVGGFRRAAPRVLIQNGDKASISRHPYVAVVTRQDGSYLCAGSLIHPRLVVTAAHCISPAVGGTTNPMVYLGLEHLQPTAVDPSAAAAITTAAAAGSSRLAAAAAAGASALNSGGGGGMALMSALATLVGLGSTGGRAAGRAVATRSMPHPKYNPGIFDYDVALLVLADDAPPAAKIVSLPAPGDSMPPSPRLKVLGWGATEQNTLSEDLRRGDVSPMDADKCGELFKPYGTSITQRMLCTTGRTCAGDSGGPLILQRDNSPDVLVGHVSFGFPRRRGQGCPQPNPATVFSDLRYPDINSWLRSKVSQLHQQLAAGVDPLLDGVDADTVAGSASGP